MILKTYEYKEGRLGIGRYVETQEMTELEADQYIAWHKLAGQIVGYEKYDYASLEAYHEMSRPENWQQHQNNLTERWYDKRAYLELFQ